MTITMKDVLERWIDVVPKVLRAFCAIAICLLVMSCAGTAKVVAIIPSDVTGESGVTASDSAPLVVEGTFPFQETALTVTPAPEVVEPSSDPEPALDLKEGSDKSEKKTVRSPAASKAGSTPSAQKYGGPTVGGFFLFTSSNSAIMASTVNAIGDTGADTLITFGSRLKPATVSNGRPEGESFSGCTVQNAGCLDVIMTTRTFNRVFTYEDKGQWSSAAFQCDGDQTLTSDNGQLFTLLVIPRNGDCFNSPDLVVSRDMSTANNANRVMIETAQQRGMSVFVGMPAPVMRSDQAWLPDMSYSETLNSFTQRFLVNYRETYQGNSALVGFYHHVEMPLKSSAGWNDVRSLYSSQNALISRYASGYAALVSPYMDARKNSASSTPLSDIPTAAKMLAQTANGVRLIIAPQDGQGTGKVGAYDADSAGNQVDAPSAAVAGTGTYSQVYLGSTGDYMSAVVAGAQGLEVWVNLELMSGSTQGAQSCEGASNGRGKASIDRVREQARIGTPSGVQKTIGFMWQPYATCGSDPLADHLN